MSKLLRRPMKNHQTDKTESDEKLKLEKNKNFNSSRDFKSNFQVQHFNFCLFFFHEKSFCFTYRQNWINAANKSSSNTLVIESKARGFIVRIIVVHIRWIQWFSWRIIAGLLWRLVRIGLRWITWTISFSNLTSQQEKVKLTWSKGRLWCIAAWLLITWSLTWVARIHKANCWLLRIALVALICVLTRVRTKLKYLREKQKLCLFFIYKRSQTDETKKKNRSLHTWA